MVVRPRPNPETVAALLDTTWRVAEAERARTESLDRKASTLAMSASLVLSLTAAFGPEATADPRSFVPYVAGLNVSEVRGEVSGGLVDAVVRERTSNQRKSRLVQYAFVCLLGGLAFFVGASILAARAIFE